MIYRPEKLWGFEKVELSPKYFNSLRLKYALIALKRVKGSVLEIGSGAGAFAKAIKRYRKDLNIIGSDKDASLIPIARKNDKKNKYKKADVQRLPFKKNHFDALVAFDVLEHVDDAQKALEEIYRVLAPGGVFHSATPLERSVYTIHGLFRLVGIIPKKIYADHVQQYTGTEMKKMMTLAGFRQIRIRYSGHLLYQLVDFCYFLSLSIIGKKTTHTVEGYVEVLPKGPKRYAISVVRSILSVLFYFESTLLKDFTGQIGHITAKKWKKQ